MEQKIAIINTEVNKTVPKIDFYASILLTSNKQKIIFKSISKNLI